MIFEYFTVQNWTDYTEPQHIHIKVLHMYTGVKMRQK